MTGQRRPSCGEIVEDAHYMEGEDKFNHPRTNDSTSSNFWNESRLFLELATTTTLLLLGFILSPLMTASYIGRRFGPVFLSGFTLANLTGNLCTFSIMSGVLSASDTLSPQAFGTGDYREVGLLAIRGAASCFAILLPINVVLVFFLESGLVALGQDPMAASYAMSWYRIFAMSLPFNIIAQVMWKFLSAQHVMRPLIIVSVLCTFVILPLGLEIFIGRMGFIGSAVAYVVFQASQMILLLAYLIWRSPHDSRTWNGLDCETLTASMNWKKMEEFLHLGSGGILVQSEWIFWEGLGLIVGKLGVIPLSVHTIPNQTIMVFCMVPFSFGVALAVRMGVTLPVSVRRTKILVLSVFGTSSVFFGSVSVVVYFLKDSIVAMFTKNSDVEELASRIWFDVCLFNFNVANFGILCGVATGLAKQWTLGALNILWLWVFGLPIIYYTTVILQHGLPATWFWINVPYAGMNICLLVLFFTTDWHAVQKKINEGRQEDGDEEEHVIQVGASKSDPRINGSSATETTSLLSYPQPSDDVGKR